MPNLPSGLVTFLLTDIEGSTRLFEEHGDAYAPWLEAHNTVISDAVTARGGVVVKTQGDSFLVAFADAREAFGAAVDAQAAIAGAGWGAPGVPKVRMAIHSGEAVPRDGDYVSIVIHKAARLLSAANGGQLLATRDAYLAAGAPATLEDAGTWRLKDFASALKIYRATGTTFDWDDRPLRASPAVRHNIPKIRTGFVGRASEMAELTEAISPGSLLTVVGPGGAGKTRLAYKVGEDLADRFEDGVTLVRLAHLTSSEQVMGEVASVLGVVAAPDGGASTIVERLAGRELLLILDNSEHVLDGCARLIDALLDGCPQAAILATSRQPIGVRGERLWRLRPLGVPPEGATDLDAHDATGLFLARAREADPDGFDPSDHERRAISALCARLDGIPLAIELAAARVRALAPSQILERLDDTFSLLVADATPEVQHHRTLTSTIEWSYRLLTDDERDVLMRAAIFAGTFTLDAAEAVCAVDGAPPVAVTLGALVDRSLVVKAPDGPRFLLLDMVRAYARERLAEAGLTAELRARHIDWAVTHSMAVARSRGQTAEGGLRPISADLRAAYTRAQEEGDTLSAMRLLIYAGETAQPVVDQRNRQVIELADHPPEGASPGEQVRLQILAVQILWSRGEGASGGSYLDEAVKIAPSVPDGPEVARMYSAIMQAHMMAGRMDNVDGMLDHIDEVAKRIGGEEAEIDALEARAMVAGERNDLDAAVPLYEEAARRTLALGRTESAGLIYNNLAYALLQSGRHQEAVDVFHAALRALGPGSSIDLRTFASLQLSRSLTGIGHHSDALGWALDALRMSVEMSASRAIAAAAQEVGKVCERLGDHAHAIAGFAIGDAALGRTSRAAADTPVGEAWGRCAAALGEARADEIYARWRTARVHDGVARLEEELTAAPDVAGRAS